MQKYYPIREASEKLREELGITREKKIVISVSKDTPIKDLPTFIKAFGMARKMIPELVAVMCGSGVTPSNEKLQTQWQEAGLVVGKDIFALGLRDDIPMIMSSSDLYVLHSAGEAFPNTLIQAMACECLCVTTDVGDAKRILEDEAMTVLPGDATNLSKTIVYALKLDEDTKKSKRAINRQIVTEKFDIRSIVYEYQTLF